MNQSNARIRRWTPAALLLIAGSTHSIAWGAFPPSLELSALNGANGFVMNGIDAHDNSGRSVASAGDINGDGAADIIIGAPFANPNGSLSGESYVVFGIRDAIEGFESEPNNSIATANCIVVDPNCDYISGKLGPSEIPTNNPNTALCAFDKQIKFVLGPGGLPLISDPPLDGGSMLLDLPLVLDTWAHTNTLRLGVTGHGDISPGDPGADGNNGIFNGLTANGPHDVLGEFTLTVTFYDDMGDPLPNPAEAPDGTFLPNPVEYVEEFRTGAEAFFINYYCPIGAASADAVVDNTTGRETVCADVDYILFKGSSRPAPTRSPRSAAWTTTASRPTGSSGGST